MALGGLQDVLRQATEIPGQIQQAELRQTQLLSSRNTLEREKRSNAFKTLKNFASGLEPNVKQKLKENPGSGNTIINELRNENRVLDEAFNDLGIEKDSQSGIGLFLNQNDEVDSKTFGIITESIIPDLVEMSRKKGIPVSEEELRENKGGTWESSRTSFGFKPPRTETIEKATQKAMARREIEEKFKTGERERKFIENASDIFKKDSIVKNERMRLGEADQLISLVGARNPFVDAAGVSLIIKFFGESGVLTDQDIKRAGGNPSFVARTRRMAQKVSEGTIPEEDRKDIVDAISIIVQASKNKLEREANKFALSKSRGFERLSKDEIFELISPEIEFDIEVPTIDLENKLNSTDNRLIQIQKESGKTFTPEQLEILKQDLRGR